MAGPPPLSLHAFNALPAGEMARLLGDVFEHAPEIAAAAVARRPFATITALHQSMLDAVAELPEPQQTAFLNKHPDLAAPTRRPSDLTIASAREQGGAGLDRLTPEQATKLADWNVDYRNRFGFPFIICALRHSRDSILAECARRRHGPLAEERRNALAEIARITALRLLGKVTGPGMPPVHGRLSTHLIDTARGRPATGIPIELWLLSEGGAEPIAAAVSNADGRTDAPLITGRPVPNGTYELRFALADYFAAQHQPPFLGTVPIRFTTTEPEAHYHIPLLFAGWSYATYRGS